MTDTPPIRTYQHLRTYTKLNRSHLMLARCTTGGQTSLAVLLDRSAEPGNWTTLCRYPDNETGERVCNVVAKAVISAAIELANDDLAISLDP